MSLTSVNLNELPLSEFRGKDNSTLHCRATFPLFAAQGSRKTATVYFEIAPGEQLGRHTDSLEEILVILEGEAEVELSGNYDRVKAGSLVLVPEMEPHNLVNTGQHTLKVLGVFGGHNHLKATFEENWMPLDSNVVNTEDMMAG